MAADPAQRRIGPRRRAGRVGGLERAPPAEPVPGRDRAHPEGGHPGGPLPPGPPAAAAPGGRGPAAVPGGPRRRVRLLRPGAPGQGVPRSRGLLPVGVAGGRVPIRPSQRPRSGTRIGCMTDNAPAPQVWHTLRARDARALIRFLVDAFGFEETVVYGEGDRVDHAQLSWPPGGGIMLGSVRDDPDDTWSLAPGSFGAYVVTDDPDGLCARATAAGAKLVMDLNDSDYGS